MRETPPLVHTTPRLYTKGYIVQFNDPVSTTHTFNTKDTPHLLGSIYEALVAVGILDTGSTDLFITKMYARLA